MTGTKESGALRYEQLSADELTAIIEIEKRLEQAKDDVTGPAEPSPAITDDYIETVEDRHPRVLLLDGGRGTGKTSLLLTLIHRWNWGLPEGSEKRIPTGHSSLDELYKGRPDHVTVIRNLDFDPLPPGMPVIAGLVQAWRPIAQAYDKATRKADCDDDEPTLSDDWHSLFSMAAAGWSEVPQQRGLVEQVLDREQQVQDWLDLAKKWRKFVDRVIDCGRCIPKGRKLKERPIFVVVIDDCDLQVRRVREILPALRMLYHPNVFFLVAAHRPHLIDMLNLEFMGQENRLARRESPARDRALADEGIWSASLAAATFEKVFPKANQWQLRPLSLREFLAFPDTPPAGLDEPQGERSFCQRLNALVPEDANSPGAGSFLWKIALRAEDMSLPGVTTYRRAHQLLDYVSQRGEGPRAALEILAGLFTPSQAHDEVSVSRNETVNVGIVGEIAALFRPELVDFAGYDFVRSNRPDFAFLRHRQSIATRMSEGRSKDVNFTALLMAKALEEKGFPVYAAGLRWDTYLSLAWTEWQLPPASFGWNRHKHPRPDQLLRQVEEWEACVNELRRERFDAEKYAYAWIYYQKRWSTERWFEDDCYDCGDSPDELSSSLPPLKLEDLKAGVSDDRWSEIENLDRDDYLNLSDAYFEAENADWRARTLPLLARPEIGFPAHVQARLLDLRDRSRDPSLKSLRRRFVTDALIASAAQRGGDTRTLPEDRQVELFVEVIDDEYRRRHGVASPWAEIEESH